MVTLSFDVFDKMSGRFFVCWKTWSFSSQCQHGFSMYVCVVAEKDFFF